MKKLLLLALIFNSFLSVTAQINIPERPKQIPFIIDSTITLTFDEKAILNQKLKNYCLTTSTEIMVMVVYSTEGVKIESYAKALGQKWGIGKRGKDNGIVMLIAKDDRNMTIQNGYGIEAVMTNAETKRIIDQVITPQFKEGDFFMGISQGLNAIFDKLKTEFTNESQTVAVENFVTDLQREPGSYQGISNVPVVAEEKSPEEEQSAFATVFAIGFLCFALFIFIVVAIIRLAQGKTVFGQHANYGYTNMGGSGVSNNFYMRPRFYNNNRNYSSSSSSIGSSSGSSFSSGSFSSGSSSSSSSGSGGSFGRGGASGGW
ncbi:TPM domain-containing protein [Flavobacterium pedocola]